MPSTEQERTMSELDVEPESKPLVRLERLSKAYPNRSWMGLRTSWFRALESVSLYIREGETFALLGESGSGKSTLARLLLRLEDPTAGRILWRDEVWSTQRGRTLRDNRKRIQMVFQDAGLSLHPGLTVLDNVAEGLRNFKLAASASERRDLALAELARLGLPSSFADRMPESLSGGERQRVAFARASVVQPELLVCDEATSQVDPTLRAHILNYLESLQVERKMSVLFISHDVPAVRHLSHRVAVLCGGRVVEMGPTADVLSRPAHPLTQAFLDASDKLLTSVRLDTQRGTGCAFFGPCQRGAERCSREVPTLEELTGARSRRVACFYPGDAVEAQRAH